MAKAPSPDTLSWIDSHYEIIPDKGIVLRDSREVGYLDKSTGYIRIDINYQKIRRTFLIWWKAKGYWPNDLIDHRDRVKTNDQIDNLHEANYSINSANRDKKTGLPEGVSKPCRSKSKPFQASIWINGKQQCIGTYSTPEEASLAYQERKSSRDRNAL